MRVSSDIGDTMSQMLEARNCWSDVDLVMRTVEAIEANIAAGVTPERLEALGAVPITFRHVDQFGDSDATIGYVVTDGDEFLLILAHTAATLDVELDFLNRVNVVGLLFTLLCKLEPGLERLEWTRATRVLRNHHQMSRVIEAAQETTDTRSSRVVLYAVAEGIDYSDPEASSVHRASAASTSAGVQARTVAMTTQDGGTAGRLSAIRQNRAALAEPGAPGPFVWTGHISDRPYGLKPIPSTGPAGGYVRAGKSGFLVERDEREHDVWVELGQLHLSHRDLTMTATRARELDLRILGNKYAANDGHPLPGQELDLETYRNAIRAALLRAPGFEVMATGTKLIATTTTKKLSELDGAVHGGLTPCPGRPGFAKAWLTFPLPPLFRPEDDALVAELRSLVGHSRWGGRRTQGGHLAAALGIHDSTGVKIYPREESDRIWLVTLQRRSGGPDTHPTRVAWATVRSARFAEGFANELHRVIAELDASPELIDDAYKHNVTGDIESHRVELEQKLAQSRQELDNALDHQVKAVVGSPVELKASEVAERLQIEVAEFEGQLAERRIAPKRRGARETVTVVLDPLLAVLAALDSIARRADRGSAVDRTLPVILLNEVIRLFPDRLRAERTATGRVAFSTELVIRMTRGSDVRLPLAWSVPNVAHINAGGQGPTRLHKQIEEVLTGRSLQAVLADMGRGTEEGIEEAAEQRCLWRERAARELAKLGVASTGQARSLLDCPIPGTGAAVWGALHEGGERPEPDPELRRAYLADVRQPKVGSWLLRDPEPVRGILAVLGAVPPTSLGVSVAELADRVAVERRFVTDLIREGVLIDRGGATSLRPCPTCGSGMSGYTPCRELADSAGLFCEACMTSAVGRPLHPAYRTPWVLRPDPDGAIRHPRTVADDAAPAPAPPSPRAGVPASDIAEELALPLRKVLDIAETMPGGTIRDGRRPVLITPRGVAAVSRAARLDTLTMADAAGVAGLDVRVIRRAIDNGRLPNMAGVDQPRRVRRRDVLVWSDGGLQGRLNIADAARHMGVRRPIVDQLIAEGELTPFVPEVGSDCDRGYLKVSDLDAVMARRALLRTSEASAVAGISRDTLQKATLEGRLSVTTVLHGKPRYDRGAIAEWASGGQPERLAERRTVRAAAREVGISEPALRRLLGPEPSIVFRLTDGGVEYVLIGDVSTAEHVSRASDPMGSPGH